jgi:hypothetical protein
MCSSVSHDRRYQSGEALPRGLAVCARLSPHKMPYAVTIDNCTFIRDYSGRLTVGPVLAAELEFPEKMPAVWLARSGVVLVCRALDLPRWQVFGQSWHVRHCALLTVRVSWEEALPALILPPAAATVAGMGPGQEIQCVGMRGALLVCRAIQVGYWEPRFVEFAAACM